MRGEVMTANETGCLLTGSTGFVGGHVLSALQSLGTPVRQLVRRPIRPGHGVTVGGMEDPVAIATAMRGVSAVIHCAAYVGGDPSLQRQVNVEGTRNLLAAAKDAGVSQFVALSTSGVYGGFLGNGLPEGAIPVHPRSSLSRSRFAAEQFVLDAGGTVVRPNIVYGVGDRLTITVVLRVMACMKAWIGEPHARISAIPVGTLGELLAALAIQNAAAGIYHAALPEPTELSSLIVPIYEASGVNVPTRSITPEVAAQSHPGVSARQFGMIARENWYDSRKIWESTRIPAPSTALTPEATRYYARILQLAGPPVTSNAHVASSAPSCIEAPYDLGTPFEG